MILLGGEYINMRNEFKSLFTHWDSMSDTEFESLLEECGVERSVPIKKLDEDLIPENRYVNMISDDTDVNRMKRNADLLGSSSWDNQEDTAVDVTDLLSA